jgi:hypothetical protein
LDAPVDPRFKAALKKGGCWGGFKKPPQWCSHFSSGEKRADAPVEFSLKACNGKVTSMLEVTPYERYHLSFYFFRRMGLSSGLSAAQARRIHLNAVILSGDKKKSRRHPTIEHAAGAIAPISPTQFPERALRTGRT